MIIGKLADIIARKALLLDAEGTRPLAAAWDPASVDGTGTADDARQAPPLMVVGAGAAFFTIQNLPRDTKVTREFVELNFLHLSPFPRSGVCYLPVGDRLLLWFHPDPEFGADGEGKPPLAAVPEGYLALQVLTGQGVRDGLAVSVDRSGDACRLKCFLVRNSELTSEFVRTGVEDPDAEAARMAARLRLELELDQLDVVPLPEDHLRQGLRRVLWRDARHFLRLGGSEERDWSILEQLRAPVAVFLVVFLAAHYAAYFSTSWALPENKARLVAIKEETAPLKRELASLRNASERWQHFRDTELTGPDVVTMLEVVSREMVKGKGQMGDIRMDTDKLVVRFTAPDATAVTEGLQSSGVFRSVTPSGAIRADKKSGMERAALVCAFRTGGTAGGGN